MTTRNTANTFPHIFNYGAQKRVEYEVSVNRFGNGFIQTHARGLSTEKVSYRVTLTGSLEDINSSFSFLNSFAKNGYPFYARVETQESGDNLYYLWIVDPSAGIRQTINAYDVANLSLTLIRFNNEPGVA